MRARLVGPALIGAALFLTAGCGVLGSPRPTATPIGGPGRTGAGSSVRSCTVDDVRVDNQPWEAAAGSRYTLLTVESRASDECLLPGSPAVALRDAAGNEVVRGLSTTGEPLRLFPGMVVATRIQHANECPPLPVTPVELAAVLLDGAFAPSSGPTIQRADELPPCNGPGGLVLTVGDRWDRSD